MANIDLAVGGSEAVVNNVLTQLFPAVQSLLKQSIAIHQVNIASIDFAVLEPFQVDLKAPTAAHMLDHYQKEMKTNPAILKMSPPDQQKLFETSMAMLDGVAFTIRVPNVAFTVNYELSPSGGQPQPPSVLNNVKLEIGAVVSIQTGSNPATIGVQGASGIVSTGDPTIDSILNEAVVPFVIDYLNKNILYPIKIPTLSTQGVTIAAPVVAIQNGFLVAYDALGTSSPAIPAPNNTWPTDGAFVAVDNNFIMAAANAALSGISPPTGSFGWWEFDGGYSTTLGPLASLSIGNDGSMQATISLGASASVTWHTPNSLPNISFSAGGSGSCTATIAVAVVNSTAVATLDSIDNINISLDGIPGYIPGISDLVNAILNTIRPAISNALSGKTFNVYNLPTIVVPLAGGININLTNIATTGVQDNGEALLVAHGMPQITGK